MPFKRTQEEDRPQKQQKLIGPPRHRESLIVRSRFCWQTPDGKNNVTALLLLDRGAVLSQQFVDDKQVPVEEKAK
jgi:hypothetical protein